MNPEEHGAIKHARKQCATAEQAMGYYSGCGYSNCPDYQTFLDAMGV